MEMRGPLPSWLATLAKTKTKASKRDPSKTLAISPLAHHAPQGYAGKVHRPRACARCEGGDRDGTKDYKISDRLVDPLIATP
jgi:hypothetical protein